MTSRYLVHRRDERPVSEEEEDIIQQTRWSRLKHAMAIAKDTLHLTDEERHDLALLLPGVDKDGEGSWKDLNVKQLNQLVWMLEGYCYINYLYIQRPVDPRYFKGDDDA